MSCTMAIGLSNFTEEQIQEILGICEVKPAILQTQEHPRKGTRDREIIWRQK